MPDATDPLAGFDGGYEGTATLLAAGRSFSAVLAFDDLTALGAIRALQERGLRVPDEVSVIGFDDIPAASLTTPSLSTIMQDMNGMGVLAAQYIMALIVPTSPGTQLATTRLTVPVVVARGSTSPWEARRSSQGKK